MVIVNSGADYALFWCRLNLVLIFIKFCANLALKFYANLASKFKKIMPAL